MALFPILLLTSLLVSPAAGQAVLGQGLRGEGLRGEGRAGEGIVVEFRNSAPVARDGVVVVSVPLARGQLSATRQREVFAVDVVDGESRSLAAAVVLLRWPDDSVALLQVHTRCRVEASGKRRLRVVPRLDADGMLAVKPDDEQQLVPAAALAAGRLPLFTELVDPWGRVLRARFEPDESVGPGGIVSASGWIQVRKFRAAHVLVEGSGADQAPSAPPGALFDLEGWLTTFAGERRAELLVVLDNRDPLAGPLGPMRLHGFRLISESDDLRFMPAFAKESLIPRARRRQQGGYTQHLLRPGDANYLGDHTRIAWRLHLFEDHESVTDAERQQARWATRRIVGFCDLDHVRASGAFSSHGGPAPLLPADLGDAGRQLQLWRATARLGPFSGLGDPEDGAMHGAPRLGDSLLHNALRWRSYELLYAAEAMVLRHGLRPSGGLAIRLPAGMAAYREGLGPLAREFPHGFTSIDYEHVSANLVFDYYWLTGDPLARDELARIGRCVERLLATVPFRTSRGEGNCLLAGVLCARATGDRELLERLGRHARVTLLPELAEPARGIAIGQPPHRLVFDGEVPFDAPAQMAQLVRGLAALGVALADDALQAAAVRVADAMAGSGWLAGVGPKTFVSAVDPGRYTVVAVPQDYLGGVRMTIGAFELAAELAENEEQAALLTRRADEALRAVLRPDALPRQRQQAMANPWLQVVFDRRARRKAN